MALRDDVKNSLKEIKKLKNNALPLNANVIGLYCYFKELIDTDIKFSKKNSGFRDVENKFGSDIASLLNKAGLAIISEHRIETKLKDLNNKYDGARKNKMHRRKR